jgi:hypothetical protein
MATKHINTKTLSGAGGSVGFISQTIDLPSDTNTLTGFKATVHAGPATLFYRLDFDSGNVILEPDAIDGLTAANGVAPDNKFLSMNIPSKSLKLKVTLFELNTATGVAAATLSANTAVTFSFRTETK